MIRLILNRTFVLDGIDPQSDFVLTLEEASFEKLTQRGSAFSSLVQFAKTARNVQFFGPLDSFNFTESSPYRLYDCDVYDDELLVFSGVFKLIETNHDFKGRVFGASAGLFDLLKGRKLTELDLSALNHTYNVTTVNNNRNSTTGFVYPNINYGLWTGQTLPGSGTDFTDFYPAVYIDDILEAACTEAGYTYTRLGSDFIIPFSKQELTQTFSLFGDVETSIDQSYTLNAGNTSQGVEFDQINNDPLSVFDYSGTLFGTYILGAKGNYFIRGSVDYDVDPTSGTSQIQVNDGTGNVYDFLTLNGGDTGTFNFELEIENTNATGTILIYVRLVRIAGDSIIDILTGSTFELISGSRTIGANDIIPIADTLPEIDVVDLFKYMAMRLNALMIADNQAKTFEFVRFTDIADDFSNYVDWSGKVVDTDNVRLLYHLDEYGQNNYLQYTVQPEADPSRNVNQIGRGNLIIDDTTLDRSKVLYETDFCRSAQYESFSNRGAIIFIPRFSTTSLDYREADIDPKPRVLKAEINSDISIKIDGVSAPPTQCNPVFSGFSNDITDHYQQLSTALNRAKVIEVELQLDNIDIDNFDVTRPVFLLNAYWFVLKIDQFEIGGFSPTKVKLLRLY